MTHIIDGEFQSDRPSIAELRRLMTEDSDEDIASDGHTCARCSGRFFVEPDLDASTMCNPCAQHVVADALPVLLEIAAAALAYEQAKVDAAVVRAAFCGAGASTERGYNAIARHDADEVRCRDAYHAALSKVRP